MTAAAPFHLAGERLMLDPAGALVWPAQRMLIVSDLHLEKSTSLAARGALLPPFDTRETLELLATFIRRYGPKTIVALGDSFHDAAGATRLCDADRARLAAIAGACRFIWVLGNHDRTPPADLPGEATDMFEIGKLKFRHQAQKGRVTGEISGHFHPKATVAVRGATISRSCFVADGYRMMLPAIGAYTGGLDIGDAAIADLFPRGGRAFLLGRERLYAFPFAASRPSARQTESLPL
jgi:DNA ligase-associated metallophosphoesterase